MTTFGHNVKLKIPVLKNPAIVTKTAVINLSVEYRKLILSNGSIFLL